ncbi:hypothetical protein AQI95_19920 [Streptomyces yokosukanensis]|uniref:Uncharacterized protein n=1 Tax=Streptomyces yokosukanensis TaxID=67386 RepID=A0A101P3Y4_9ACTN|nr:hypothetical protein AQI95_19920 [Streptomyces yokosukanensis]
MACVLVIAERVGEAVRSPTKDTLLSHATAATGRGRGFAVHEAAGSAPWPARCWSRACSP